MLQPCVCCLPTFMHWQATDVVGQQSMAAAGRWPLKVLWLQLLQHRLELHVAPVDLPCSTCLKGLSRSICSYQGAECCMLQAACCAGISCRPSAGCCAWCGTAWCFWDKASPIKRPRTTHDFSRIVNYKMKGGSGQACHCKPLLLPLFLRAHLSYAFLFE